MCGGGSSPSPAPPPPAPNRAPEEIESAVDSNAEQRKKKSKGSKQLNRDSSAAQTNTESSGGTGLTINK